MTRAVLDTNIVVSALLFFGHPAQILERAAEGQFTLLSSDLILDELFETFSKPKFAKVFAAIEQTPAQYVERFRGLVEIIDVPEPHEVATGVVRDEDDEIILACAVDGKADYIVTGDKDLLDLRVYREILIVSVGEMLERLSSSP